MHRDIKGSNLLVNNEGILKVADFGLANFCDSAQRQPLTSRVVTLWYRPPELLLGSTDYGASVDLWSVGCVLAEIITGKPILQGRTEVEQLHKIFKLCGSPPDDYWRRSRLPHATLFKPQQPYYSSLRETFRDLPPSAVNLIQTLLSVEPQKRGTASHALSSEYFRSKPYACDPSSLPIYPPSKEIDAKNRGDAKRVLIPRQKRLNSRVPFYLSHIEWMSSWRNMNVISAKQYANHGFKELNPNLRLDPDPKGQGLVPILVPPLDMCERECAKVQAAVVILP
ncbi:hypothetical protein SAY86_003251 [Trapa natans]|uniref:Protein kinase domain-containing protein n=1 Tax=Trapa natans TaxID=22666 RepID=A0AAN7RET0_TRANT|nr:hypothetical protein SAY86_003251 [Trapa natans]